MVLIGLGSFLRLLAPLINNPLDNLFSDPKRHWLNAKHFFDPSMMGGSDPIFYQVYLYGIQLVSQDNRFVVGALAGLLSCLMPWTYYRAAREFGLSYTRSLLCWAMIVWVPSLFTVYQYFMSETLLLALVGLALWMSARHLRKGTMASFLWATACWTLAILTKPTPAPLALLCLGYCWWQRSRKLSHGVVALFLVLLMLLPGTVRSYRVLGFPAPLGNMWIHQTLHQSGCKFIRIHWGKSVFMFGSPSCWVQPLAPFNRWMIQRGYGETEFEVTIDRERGSAGWSVAKDRIQDNWEKWFYRLCENIVLFLFAPSWPESNQDTWVGLANYWSRWVWAPIIFLVLEFNFSNFWKKKIHPIALGTTLMVVWLLLQNSFTMEGRYRKAVEPLILVNLALMLPLRMAREVGNHTSG